MNIDELSNFQFYLSLGYITIISSILTIILVQIYKILLKKKKVITPEMDSNKKDNILSRAGRIIALILYSLIYLANEYYFKHSLVINETLVIGLLSGGAATLTVAKGLYTSIRQYQKKKSVFDKLALAEEKLTKLQEQIVQKQTKIILTKKEDK